MNLPHTCAHMCVGVKVPGSMQVCKFPSLGPLKGKGNTLDLFFPNWRKIFSQLSKYFLIINSQFLITMFRPIAMKKSELAHLYFPQTTLVSATNRLMCWIYSCPPLLRELEATGYHRSQKLLTSRQVVLITTHLGDP